MTSYSSGDRVRVLRDFMSVAKGDIVTLRSYDAWHKGWWLDEIACWLAEEHFEHADKPAVAVDHEKVIDYPDGNPKTVYGMQKPAMSAVPPLVLLQLGGVMSLGARKYGRFNWRDKSVTASVYTDAINRHLLLWVDGEENDPESRCSHLAHIMACCAVLIDAAASGKLNDDRSKTNQVAEYIDGYEVNANIP
jgi:hypothetical protein